MVITTKLTKLLNVKHPIVQGKTQGCPEQLYYPVYTFLLCVQVA